MGLVIVIEFIFAGIRGIRLKVLKKWDRKVFFRQEFCGPFGGWGRYFNDYVVAILFVIKCDLRIWFINVAAAFS